MLHIEVERLRYIVCIGLRILELIRNRMGNDKVIL